MKPTVLQRMRDQRGVAMVTVLLIAAALTAVASAAAFTTIKEFRSSTQDRRSARALAYAEAGIDRMINYIKNGKIKWSDIALAGCPVGSPVRYTGEEAHPALTLPGGGQGTVGSGSYSVKLEVYNPITPNVANRSVPGACSDASYPRVWDSPKVPANHWSGTSQYFAIIATGASAPSATPCPQLAGGACRTVRQVVRIRGVGLPVGIYAKTSADMSGNPSMQNISLVTPGTVTGRDKVGFSGLDPYYYVGDFTDWSSMAASTKLLHVPAAVHAGGSISLGGVVGSRLEHPTTSLLSGTSYLNCTANRTTGTSPNGTPGQSMWDQSGPGYGGATSGTCTWTSPSGGPPNVPPPTSVISDVRTLAPQPDLSAEDYAALKATAQQEGIWCSIPASGAMTCRRSGQSWAGFGSGTLQATDVTGASPALPNTFIAYIEYATAGSTLKWKPAWGPCSDDPDVNKQVIIIVRKGHLDISGGGTIHGAAIVPEGDVEESGGGTFEGTIIANNFRNRGNAAFRLTECAIRNLPGPWLDITPAGWVEVDR
jgi:hypothetical protein